MKKSFLPFPGFVIIFFITIILYMNANAQILPENYDPFLRPNVESGPTEVEIGIYVYDIIEISDVDRTCTIDFFVNAEWIDPRLALESSGVKSGNQRLPIESVWNPKILLANQREIEKKYPNEVTIDKNGVVHYFQRYNGTIIFAHDLHDFPFDSQALNLTFVSRGYDSTEVKLVEYKRRTGQSASFSIADWSIYSGHGMSGSLFIAPRNKHLSTWIYSIAISRQAGFYIWKVIVPLCLIIFMSWTIFIIRPDQVGAQIGISTASVLTLIIFQFSLSQLVPKVSYLTRIDQFSVGAIILVFLALLESIYTVMLWVKGRETHSMRMDRWSLLIFPTLFILNYINAFVI